MICFPNAKINLGLNIVSKRDDGYHNLETIFYPIPLQDALEAVPSSHTTGSFTQTGIPVDGDPANNLVMKAYRLFKEKYSIPEMDIYLRKQIPFGAGLGGGSADAAFMLKLLSKETNLNISDEELEAMASQLGADCPFFIRNKPAFATGIGNIFEPIELDLSAYQFVLIKPDVHVSTKEAYAMVKPTIPEMSLKEIVRMPVEEWKNRMQNDFEFSVFPKYPEIEQIKNELYECGAIYASMSGSGSSVFGLFDLNWQSDRIEKDKYPYLKIWNRLDTQAGQRTKN